MAKKKYKRKILNVVDSGKNLISSGIKTYKENKIANENIEAIRLGKIEGQKRRLNALNEEAKVKALLEFRANQELQSRLQPPQIVSMIRKRPSIYSFVNKPFMNDDFMESDPFSFDSPNPFFPRKKLK